MALYSLLSTYSTYSAANLGCQVKAEPVEVNLSSYSLMKFQLPNQRHSEANQGFLQKPCNSRFIQTVMREKEEREGEKI